MKYLQEIGVIALIIIAFASVYEIVHHKQHCHKQDNVMIQDNFFM